MMICVCLLTARCADPFRTDQEVSKVLSAESKAGDGAAWIPTAQTRIGDLLQTFEEPLQF